MEDRNMRLKEIGGWGMEKRKHEARGEGDREKAGMH